MQEASFAVLSNNPTTLQGLRAGAWQPGQPHLLAVLVLALSLLPRDSSQLSHVHVVVFPLLQYSFYCILTLQLRSQYFGQFEYQYLHKVKKWSRSSLCDFAYLL